MANIKISNLTTSSVLDGTELIPIVQNGANKQATVDQLVTKVDSYTKAESDSAMGTKADKVTVTYTKEVKEFNKNPIEGKLLSSTNAYAICYNYNNEIFNSIETFIKVKENTTLRVMIVNPSEFNKDWWTRGYIAKGEIAVTPYDRYVTVDLDIELNSSNITEGYFYIILSAEGGQVLAAHNIEITETNDGGFKDLYSVTGTETTTDNGYRAYEASAQNAFYKFWFKMLLKNYQGVRCDKIEQDKQTQLFDDKIVHYPIFYNCENVEAHIYFNNFKKSLIDNFGFKYSCSPYDFTELGVNHIGEQQDERYIKSNASLVMGANDELANINFFDRYFQEVNNVARFRHITVEASNGNGQTCNFVAIGESTTADGIYTQRMLDIASNDVLTLNLVGTRGTAPNHNEGKGGVTMYWHTTDSGSAFVNGGVLDYPNYVTNLGVVPDVLSIQEGINAMLLVKKKYDLAFYINREMTAYTTFINHVKVSHPETKFIINTCILPCELQSAFGANYDTFLQRDNYRENVQAYNENLIELFKDRENENIYLNCNQTLQLDCNYGFPQEAQALSSLTTQTVVRGTNGVHPADYGYKLMGDGLWSCLKYLYK